MYSDLKSMPKGTQRSAIYFVLKLCNADSASSQKMGGVLAVSNATNTANAAGFGDISGLPEFISGIFATSAEDTSSAKTFGITVQHATANANLSFRREMVITELMQ